MEENIKMFKDEFSKIENLTDEERDTIIVSYLREEFKNKFGFDPYTRR